MMAKPRMALVPVMAMALAAPLHGQSPGPPSACKAAEFRTLDFWVGDWVAEDQEGRRIGTNRITRDEYGECVITEHFRTDDGSMVGHSVSIYVPALKQWRQNWVDNQGSYFDLVGGPVSSGDYQFVFENKRPAEAGPYLRMIFQDVKPERFTWRWQKRAKAEDPWSDSWVIQYRKRIAQ